MTWFCCQLGAREHYAVPRALHRSGALQWLFADAWIMPGHPLGLFKQSLRERYHVELADADVFSANVSLLAFEAQARLNGLTGWSRIMARNQWFQKQALRQLSSIVHRPSSLEAPTVFAYSYAARDIFRWAKAQGWQTVLGQIDAGPEMSRIVQRLEQRYPEYQSHSDCPPEVYWKGWREECALADRIIVNSDWSRKAMEMEGIDTGKVRVIPLAYSPPSDSTAFRREYPAAFSSQRPMRVLFLGKINLAKGLASVLEAAENLVNEPVEFQMVGPVQVTVPEKFRQLPNINWLGSVSRGAVTKYYQAADVFLFPTYSDGFGLTQLEAQAWQLPVVASRFCGKVVQDKVNGLELAEISGAGIASVLRQLLSNPGNLTAMARASAVNPQFCLDEIAAGLESTFD